MNTPLFCRSVVTGLVLSATVLTSFAQAQSTTPDETLETLTVTGSRSVLNIAQLAGNVSILTEADIANSQATFVSELLTAFTSIDVSVNGGVGQYAELRIRGAEANHVLVLLDGVQINDQAQGGLIDLAHLPTHNIERIELLRGAQSAVWGDGAIGGVLSITTKQGGQDLGSVQFNVGQNDTYHANLQHSGTFAETAYHVSFSHFDTDGQNISTVAGNTETDGYQNTQFHLNLSTQLGQTLRLQSMFRLNEYATEYDATDFVTTGLPVDADNVSEGEKRDVKLALEYRPAGTDWYVDTSLHHHVDQVDNIESGRFASASKSTENKALAVWHYANSDQASINLGVEYADVEYSQAGPIVFGDPNYQTDIQRTSVFADNTYALFDDVWLNASVRYTDNSEFASATDYRVGSSWQVNAPLRIFVSHGRASKTPTFTERFGFFPTSFIGNPNLKPETATTSELGVALDIAQTTWSLTLFDTDLDNEINGFVFDANSGGFTADNVSGQSKRSGLELDGRFASALGQWQLSYSYLDASDGATNARELRRAQHNGAVTLTSQPTATVSTYLSARYTGTRTDQFFPPFPAPSQVLEQGAYWLVNTSVNWQARHDVKVGLKAENIFAQKYTDIVGYRGLERKFSAYIQYQW